MSAIANLPDIRPSLLLDFANGRRVDPRVQCTRSSAATCWGPDGKRHTVAANVPRIDFDPVTRKCLGLLVEEARTNYGLNSVFAGAVSGSPGTAPTSYGFTVAGGETVAAGEVLRFKTASSLRHFIGQTVSVDTGSYTFSVYADAVTPQSVINSANVVAGSAAISTKFYVDEVLAASTDMLTPGRKRISVGVEVTSPGTLSFRFGVGVNGATTAEVGFEAPQFEAGTVATSYIPTESSAATRAADLPFISTQGWFTSLEGTLVARGYARNGSVSPLLKLGTGGYTGFNGAGFEVSASGQLTVSTRLSGDSGVYHQLGLLTPSSRAVPFSMSAGYSAGANVFPSAFGTATGQRAIRWDGTADFLWIGAGLVGGDSSVRSSSRPNSCISSVAFYTKLLTSAQIQRLSA